MNIAIGLGTLLLGGWVLPSGEAPPSDIELPSAPGETTTLPPTPPTPPSARGEGPARRSAGGPMDSSVPGYRFGGSLAEPRMPQGVPGLPRTSGTVPEDRMVPLAPTDPDLRSPDSPLAAPTESTGETLPGFGTRSYGTGSPYGARPTAPYRGPSAASRTSRSRYGQPASQTRNLTSQLAVAEQQAQRLQPSPGIGAAAPRVSKPFANYTPPPAVSPYTELYRRGTAGVDNYNAFVRPSLEQSRANQVFGGEIRGLQSSQQLQRAALQRLGKVGGQPNQPVIAPEYFQNYRAFYPSFR